MKTFEAYDVNQRALYKELLDAKQPVVAIKFFGPALTKVSALVLTVEDTADDKIVTDIIGRLSAPKPKTASIDRTIVDLKKLLK